MGALEIPDSLVLTSPEVRTPTPMDLLSVALHNHSAIDVIERLAALQEKAQARDAEIQFNEAMNKAQSEIGRIAPDKTNTQTNSKWATYAKLDSVLRPIYVRHGFSLSFNSGDSPLPETVRVTCFVSHRGGHTREYTAPPIPSDGKGAKGGDVMTKTHAAGSAMSYGARYLLKYIFNVAIGEEDTDGNSNGELAEQIEWMMNARNPDELKKLYKNAYEKFEESPAALKVIVQARKKKQGEFDAN